MSNVEMRRANRWCSCFELDEPTHRNQVASETVHGARLAITELSNCATCVEENNVCKCREGSGVVSFRTENHTKKPDSSFAHSVINMVGMLIGTYISGLSSLHYSISYIPTLSESLFYGLHMILYLLISLFRSWATFNSLCFGEWRMDLSISTSGTWNLVRIHLTYYWQVP